MAQLVHMINPNDRSEEGVVIDTDDTPDAKLNEEYAPLAVEDKVQIKGDCGGMPTDRLLVTE